MQARHGCFAHASSTCGIAIFGREAGRYPDSRLGTKVMGRSRSLTTYLNLKPNRSNCSGNET